MTQIKETQKNTSKKKFDTRIKYDLVVIGGGPAGYVGAIKGKLLGLNVAIIEEGRIGGACINRGCIPTKALWGTATLLHRMKTMDEHGITAEKIRFDFGKAVKRQFQVMDQLIAQIEGRMKRLGIETYFGRALPIGRTKSGKFFSIPFESTKESSDKKEILELTARNVLIATGSRPAEAAPLIADHKNILTTDDIVQLTELPKRICIAGGGVVACEFASILRNFGAEVDLLEHNTQVLSAMDPEVVSILMDEFAKDGIRIHLTSKTKNVYKQGNDLIVEFQKGENLEKIAVDTVLMAIGRKPNSENLGLENLGVKFSDRGHIVIDSRCETTCKGVYAAGDVVGGLTLAHKAWYEADVAIRAIAGEEVKADYYTVPAAIFTIPEMASVGLSFEQAHKQKLNISIGKFRYQENAQALCIGQPVGLIKTVIDQDSSKVLGCTMIGHDASNLISEVALAMAAGLSVAEMTKTIHPHPTLSEMVLESFLDTQGRSVHKY